MDTDSGTAAADLEGIGTRAAHRLRLIVQDLVRGCGVPLVRAEFEHAIADTQGIQIIVRRLRGLIDKTGRAVAAGGIVANQILAVIENQAVLAAALGHRELVTGIAVVCVGDDTAGRGYGDIGAVRGALEEPLVSHVGDQVGAAHGESRSLHISAARDWGGRLVDH